MSKKEIVVVDNGNRNLKIKSNSGGKQLFPNALARYTESFGESRSSNIPENELDIEIIKDGISLGRKCFGTKAISRKPDKKIIGSKKYKSKEILFSSLAGAAISLLDMNDPKNIKKDIILGTLLPMNEYQDSENEKVFRERLSGNAKVIFRGSNFNTETTVELNISNKDVYIFPEGAGAAHAILFDENGNLKDKLKALLNKFKNLVILDLGGSTLDLTALTIEDGSVVIIHEMNQCLNYGMQDAEIKIIERINKELKLPSSTELEPFYIDYLIRKGEMKLTIQGTEKDFSKIVDEELQQLTQDEISDVVNKVRSIEVQNLKNSFVFGITGGANEVILDRVESMLEEADVTYIRSEDPLFDNVTGAYNQIKLILEKIEEAEKEVFERV